MSDFLKRIAEFSPKRLLLLAAELEERVRALEARNRAPIAIIGVGCRFPGGIRNAETYWELLSQGRDAITEVPSWRWDVGALYDPDPHANGRVATRWGGFLESPELFDPPFFGIAPVEARGMDPQQRLLPSYRPRLPAVAPASLSAYAIRITRNVRSRAMRIGSMPTLPRALPMPSLQDESPIFSACADPAWRSIPRALLRLSRYIRPASLCGPVNRILFSLAVRTCSSSPKSPWRFRAPR